MFDLAQIIAGQQDPVQNYLRNYLGVSQAAYQQQDRQAAIEEAKLRTKLMEHQQQIEEERNRIIEEARKAQAERAAKATEIVHDPQTGAWIIDPATGQWKRPPGYEPKPPKEDKAPEPYRVQGDNGVTSIGPDGKPVFTPYPDGFRKGKEPAAGGSSSGMGPREYQAYQMYLQTYGDPTTGVIRSDAPPFEDFLKNPSAHIGPGKGARKPGSSAGVEKPSVDPNIVNAWIETQIGQRYTPVRKPVESGSSLNPANWFGDKPDPDKQPIVGYEDKNGNPYTPEQVRMAVALEAQKMFGGQMAMPSQAQPATPAAAPKSEGRYIETAPNAPGAKFGTPPGLPKGWYIYEKG